MFHKIGFLVVIPCFISGVISTSSFCAGICDSSHVDVFKEHHTYIYMYLVKTITKVNGSSIDSTQDENVGLVFKAQIEVFVLSKCELILQITDIVLDETIQRNVTGKINSTMKSEREKEFSSALTKYALNIHYHSGRIVHICPSELEPAWVLNIKRGIISALQYSWNYTDEYNNFETDIHGLCESHYTKDNSDGWIVLNRHRVLENCIQNTSGQSEPNTNIPVVYSKSLLRSIQDCRYVLGKERQPIIVSCEEIHYFRLFSAATNGAVTRIRQRLDLDRVIVKVIPNIGDSMSPIKTSLTFERQSNEKVNSYSEILDALNSIVLDNAWIHGTLSTTASKFAHLVSCLETSNDHTLNNILYHCPMQEKRYLFEALVYGSTPESIKVAHHLLEIGYLPRADAFNGIRFLAFTKEPTLEVLAAVEVFNTFYYTRYITFQLDDFKNPTLFAISSLVYRYCKENFNCKTENEVMEIMNHIEYPLRLYAQKAITTDLLFALRSIGNAGITYSLNIIESILQNTTISKMLRLAAISSYRRMSCSEASRGGVFEIFIRKAEDSDVRIEAYLTVMQCLSPEILNKILHVLQYEKADEVGSFVWSHLKAVDDKAVIDLLNTKYATFVTGYKKNSRHYKNTIYVSSDVNLELSSSQIFNEQNLLPLSLTFGLAVHINGDKYDILEVGSHLWIIEPFLTKLFGPSGLLPIPEVEKFIMRYKLRNENYQIDSESQIYVRILGNEILYMDHESISNEIQRNLMDILYHFAAELSDKVFHENIKLFQNNFIYPTAVGFPLKIYFHGVLSVTLKLLSVGKKEPWVNEFSPSFAVDVSGSMILDATTAKAGVSASLTASSKIDFGTKSTHNNEFKLDLFINQHTEIFKLITKIYLIHNNTSIETEGIVKFRDEVDWCASENIGRIIGYQLCNCIIYSNGPVVEDALFFPFTRPISYILNIKTTDSFNYATVRYIPHEFGFNVLWDTPNSSTNRKLNIESLYFPQNKSLIIYFDMPTMKLNFNSSINSGSFDGSVLLDDIEGSWNLIYRLQLVNNNLENDFVFISKLNGHMQTKTFKTNGSNPPVDLVEHEKTVKRPYEIILSATSQDLSPGECCQRLVKMNMTFNEEQIFSIRVVYNISEIHTNISLISLVGHNRYLLNVNFTERPNYNLSLIFSSPSEYYIVKMNMENIQKEKIFTLSRFLDQNVSIEADFAQCRNSSDFTILVFWYEENQSAITNIHIERNNNTSILVGNIEYPVGKVSGKISSCNIK